MTVSPRWTPIAGGIVLGLLVLVALFAPILAPYDPALSTGSPLVSPNPAHLLGTNDIGQDIFSELIWGGRSTLVVAAGVAILSTSIAWAAGIASGLWRPFEWIVVPIADVLLALPSLPLFMLVVTVVRPSLLSIIFTLGLLSWPGFARIVRAEVIALRNQPYLEAARALGAVEWRIATAHVLPATLTLLPAKLILTVRYAIFAEATLAFLGLGEPAMKSWGGMLGLAFSYPLLFPRGVWPWWVAPPAAAIALVVLATTWIASGFDGRRSPR